MHVHAAKDLGYLTTAGDYVGLELRSKMAITAILEYLEAAKAICKQYRTAVQDTQVINGDIVSFHTLQSYMVFNFQNTPTDQRLFPT